MAPERDGEMSDRKLDTALISRPIYDRLYTATKGGMTAGPIRTYLDEIHALAYCPSGGAELGRHR